MIIDCDSCRARPRACGDCVVSHLLATAPAGPPVDIDDGALAAVGTLAAAGLVPPLRLVSPVPLERGGAGSTGLSLEVTTDPRSGDDTLGPIHRKTGSRDIA